jgi:hypothetical protein
MKRMFQGLRWKLIVLLLFSSIFTIPFQISAEEEYLIVRIIDAEYPPRSSVHKDENWTGFTFKITYQIENPTPSPIVISFVCGPYPFPYLRTKLQNSSLRVEQGIIIEWVLGEHSILPGRKNESYKFYFAIENHVSDSLPIGTYEMWFDHVSDSLPIGTYEMWFDYTNCSSVPVPVVKEKLLIKVSESNVTYDFDYNSETRVVSTLEETSYMKSIFASLIILVLIVKRTKRKK